MILLEPGNRILEETLNSQINPAPEEKRDGLDVTLCDFDDVSYKVQVDKGNTDLLKLSMGIPCYREIDNKGGKQALEKYYGEFSGSAENNYDITLHVKIPDVKDKEATIKKLQLIKSNITGGVFDYFFSALLEGKSPEKAFKFDLRKDTTVYFFPRDDRVTVVFSVDFNDDTDKVIAKVFMQEFVDARKKIGRAPPCAWGVNPPNELAEFNITSNQGNLGYISFAVLKSHLDKGKKEVVIGVLQTFRTYLQYHIKCSKSHFHARMRLRVRELLKVLNRAKVTDEKKEKKTAAGKTFKRS